MEVRDILLAFILSQGALTHQMRLVLSIVIAKAAWQFYESGWMVQDWTKELVRFLCTLEDRVAGALYTSKPFLSVYFWDTKGEHRSSKLNVYSFSKILSLRILLLEIELDVTIESIRPSSFLRPDS